MTLLKNKASHQHLHVGVLAYQFKMTPLECHRGCMDVMETFDLYFKAVFI